MFNVFVYGTLRKGQGNRRIIEEFIVNARPGTVGAVLFDNGSFPYAILSEDHVAVGEWITFDKVDQIEVMHRLDRLEGYRGDGESNHYDRVMVRDLSQDIEGWMYVVTVNSPRGKRIAEQYPLIASGDWSKREDQLYFAYGSCMSADSFMATCPDARRFGAGTLPKHRLVFATNRNRSSTSGVATVVPDKKENAVGILWHVSKNDRRALHRREGAPYVYSEQWGTVDAMIRVNGQKVTVLAPVFYYTLNMPWVMRRPSEFYMGIIKRGWGELHQLTV